MLDFLTIPWDKCLSTNSVSTGVPTLGCVWIAIQNVINALTALAGVVALFLIVYSGIKFITSGGDKEKLESAKKTLTFAIIGLVFIMFSFVILKIISDLTGISYTTLITPPGGMPR